MKISIFLAVGLVCASAVQDKMGLPAEALAQAGSSISSDGSAPNNNAMLDVKSPATGDGKGILIPRVTEAQRTTASAALAGGLLDNSGNLRGGAAQGLIIYQTDGSQGLYFNASSTATPAWVYLGTSTTNYLPLTGGTMSGAINMGGQIVSNVSHIDFIEYYVSVGRDANGTGEGAAVGRSANGAADGAALGYQANGYNSAAALGREANAWFLGAAVGYSANAVSYGAALGEDANALRCGVAVGSSTMGTNYGVAVGNEANGSITGVAVGAYANGYNSGAAIGVSANGAYTGVAAGASANGNNYGVAIGYQANGYDHSAAIGYQANGYFYGAGLGYQANGRFHSAAVGYNANGNSYGVAMGSSANGVGYGAALGTYAKGTNSGAAVGYSANGSFSGGALGAYANGVNTNVAIGAAANAQGGTERIAIGHNVTNNMNDTARIRGTLYLDGGTGVVYRETFGSGAWSAKAFEIDHPLDPENKILRHFCLEGPQVWNVYAGNVQLVNGQAVVELPDYYSALNLAGSEVYSLTSLGDAFVWIAAKVSDNCFVIAGKRDIEVSWTIKVLRNDPGCREDLRRRPVEQRKNEILNSRTVEQ